MGLTFQRETIASVFDEALTLAKLNLDETGFEGMEGAMPDRERYLQIEKAVPTFAFTARSAGELVGYALFVVLEHVHYPGKYTANQENLYVRKDFRGIPAVKFIHWMDDQLESDSSVDYIVKVVSVRNDYSRILDKMGYEIAEKSYIKHLKKEERAATWL